MHSTIKRLTEWSEELVTGQKNQQIDSMNIPENIPVGCIPLAFLIRGGGTPYRDPPGRNMGSGTETSLEGAMDHAAG